MQRELLPRDAAQIKRLRIGATGVLGADCLGCKELGHRAAPLVARVANQ